uniref:Uncharacterized protein n=1 Tax=Plectus sambesii TaxID=2011161 RepID=A0A914VEZ2_9BILA
MFLVLMFNKDVCNEASKRFPPNAYCITTHSLAYNHMVPSSNGSLVKLGARYSRKFGFKLKTTDVVKVLKHVEGYNTYVRAKNAIATLENFLYTADAELSTEHVPCWERDEHNVT